VCIHGVFSRVIIFQCSSHEFQEFALKDHKLDIFQALRAIDQNDGDWLTRQAEDVRKAFKPLVVMRWAATVNDGPQATYMLWMINERVNQYLFELYHHPDLVFRLLASCGLGTVQKHQFISFPGQRSHLNSAAKLLQDVYPYASESEIQLLLALFDHASFKQFVDDCGIQPDEAKEMIKQYDKLIAEKA